jgi:hypothetical protein
MKIPNKLKIGGHQLEVKIENLNSKEPKCATTFVAGNKIILNSQICPSQREESFLHEIIHHILFHAGYNELVFEEKLVQSLASGLYQVLKDNDLLK